MDMAGKTSAQVKTYFEEMPKSVRQNMPSDSLDAAMPADTAVQLMELFVDTQVDAAEVPDVQKATMESVSPLQLTLYTKVVALIRI